MEDYRPRWSWYQGCVQFSEYDDDGFLGVQADPQGQTGGSTSVELSHPYGFASRPLDPDPSGLGCSLIVGSSGSSGAYVSLGHDPRVIKKIPPLEKGSSVQYASTGSFGLMDSKDGTWTLYIPTEVDGDGNATAAHLIQVGVDGGGKPSISIIHSEGNSIVMFKGKTVISSPGGGVYLEVSDTGIVANGTLKCVSGMDIGGATAQPLVNLTLFTAWWTALVAAVNAAGPAPLLGSALGAILATAGATIPTIGTQFTKGT